ncbi:hypothetical protein BV22DRAFT_1035082 [Leucogyrophana mollusca]|uniref:Uncharacterized protein n=1 Tax=Leucogyrophana mollusca TaxID=85980 RepID=A0ACB8BGV1_9AGAM|nr:hypothetical protein BV22DRAFT_1035082 [Leucogyrophana mollusca]
MQSESAIFARDPILYFADGNIVLSALTSEKKGTLFRIHKSVLSLHSPVFADMFALPEPPSGVNDAYDGVPLVHLHDDAIHVRELLQTFYQPTSLNLVRYDPNTPDKIRGCLLLAKKYQIKSLYDHLVKHFRADWPQSLQEWDALEEEIGLRLNQFQLADINTEFDINYVDDVFPEPASAIRLARELDIPEILPAAFYQLSRLDVTHDRDRWADYTGYDDFYTSLREGERSAHWSLLTSEELIHVFLGREGLQRFAQSLQWKFRHVACTKCCSGPIQDFFDSSSGTPTTC